MSVVLFIFDTSIQVIGWRALQHDPVFFLEIGKSCQKSVLDCNCYVNNCNIAYPVKVYLMYSCSVLYYILVTFVNKWTNVTFSNMVRCMLWNEKNKQVVVIELWIWKLQTANFALCDDAEGDFVEELLYPDVQFFVY